MCGPALKAYSGGSSPPAAFSWRRGNAPFSWSARRSKRATAEIDVILMGSVIAGQNTAMLESIYPRYDRAFQLCCLSTHCLIKMCEVIEHFTSSTSLAATDFLRGAAIQK